MKKITAKEVEANSTAASLWVILNGKVYDLTNFDHPGGAHEILEYAGKDITKAFKLAGKFSKMIVTCFLTLTQKSIEANPKPTQDFFENSKGHGNSELGEVESHLIGVLEEPASTTSGAV